MTSESNIPRHCLWSEQLRDAPPESALESPLLALEFSSDIQPVSADAVMDARSVLRLRSQSGASSDGHRAEIERIQRRIVERFLTARRADFGVDQVRLLASPASLVAEGRDIFVVVKYMDEAVHIVATVASLVEQCDVDLKRLLVVAVDNNSTDGSSELIRDFVAQYAGSARIECLTQMMPGAGHAARLGVDSCVATVHAMCTLDGDWGRLARATIGVSDGDTTYAPQTLAAVDKLLLENQAVDGVMPFLTYKWASALRLFRRYSQPKVRELQRRATGLMPTEVPFDLLPPSGSPPIARPSRRLVGARAMELDHAGGCTVVSLDGTDPRGLPFGLLQDPDGLRGFVLADRSFLLWDRTYPGFDDALLFLEQGHVARDEKWRWHALIGHDLFLFTLFGVSQLPTEIVFPDTSDALKTFRLWAFAAAGQHQLCRPDIRFPTGCDYQSGRVLQAIGHVIVLGPVTAFAETEIDRLTKMMRNLVREQHVFYGPTRSGPLERATGHYFHLSRIQGSLEREARAYPDALFQTAVFPERMLFLLRWLIQNALRYASQGDAERTIARERVFGHLFGGQRLASEIDGSLLADGIFEAIARAPYPAKQSVAEQFAEQLIAERYPPLLDCYRRSVGGLLRSEGVNDVAWLFEDLETARCAAATATPTIDSAIVWHEGYDLDRERAQVVRWRND